MTSIQIDMDCEYHRQEASTAMKDIIDHHDRFFKEMFASREVARSFLMHYLPEEISAIVNADSVQLSKDSYTDSRLRSQFSDLLYNVKLNTGHDAHIYVLFEHKGTGSVQWDAKIHKNQWAMAGWWRET